MRTSRLSLVRPNRSTQGVTLPWVDSNVAAHVRWMRLRGMSSKTVELRLTVLGLLMRHAGRPLLDLDQADLDAWQSTLGVLALESRRAYVVQARGFYAWAADTGLVAENPAAVLVTPRVPKGVPRPMPEQDLERALAEAPPMIRIWLELAAYAGLRAAEIAVLERADVLDTALIPSLVVHGKGGKTRVVPLAPEPLASLEDLPMPARGRLFRRPDGRPVTAKYVSEATGRFLRRRGFTHSLHKLRHRFATAAYRVSKDLRLVQELLGHESPATTAIYTLVDPAAAAPVVAKIDRPLLRPVAEEEETAS